MAATLVSCLETLQAETGLDILDGVFPHHLTLDAPLAGAPLLLRTGARSTLLLRHQDHGNWAAAGRPDLPVLFYRQYFTFEDLLQPPPVSPTVGHALARCLDGERTIVCDSCLPLAVYQEIAGQFQVEHGFVTPPPSEVSRYALRRADVLRRFEAGSREAEADARRLAGQIESGATLLRWLDRPRDTRFQVLESLMGSAGLSAVLVTSWHNLQELTGLARNRLPEEAVALFRSGDQVVHLLAAGPVDLPRLGSYPSMRKAIADLAGSGALGVEELDLTLGRFRAWGLDGREVREASIPLRMWRELRGNDDLEYFLVASMAARAAIEGALAWAGQAIARGEPLTELDVKARYLDLVGEFMREQRISLRWQFYFGSIFAGTRTLYPSAAVRYPLDRSINTLKIDSGITLYDGQGLYRACSDLCRTLTLTEEGTEVYDLLVEAVLHHGIPAARDGATGRDLHQACLSFLEERQPRLEEIGMLPATGPLGQVYPRHVGHLLGKQEPPGLPLFTPRATHPPLRVGMVACVEIPWHYRRHGISVEDTFFLSEEGPVVLTR